MFFKRKDESLEKVKTILLSALLVILEKKGVIQKQDFEEVLSEGPEKLGEQVAEWIKIIAKVWSE